MFKPIFETLVNLSRGVNELFIPFFNTAQVTDIAQWQKASSENQRRVLFYREPKDGAYSVVFICAVDESGVSVGQFVPMESGRVDVKTASLFGPRANCGRALAKVNNL